MTNMMLKGWIFFFCLSLPMPSPLSRFPSKWMATRWGGRKRNRIMRYMKQKGNVKNTRHYSKNRWRRGDHCDKVEMVLIVAACCGGLGVYKGKFPMSEEYLRSATPRDSGFNPQWSFQFMLWWITPMHRWNPPWH